MSDRFPGKLTIGGKLTADQLATLIDTIAMEGEGSLEYGDKPASWLALDEHTGHLVICNAEARNGEFEHTEAALIEAGIAWQRHSSAYCGDDAEIVWWHPGMDGQTGNICDDDGNLLCPMVPVAAALVNLESALNSTVSIETSAIVAARDLLRTVVVKIPTLPRMEFV